MNDGCTLIASNSGSNKVWEQNYSKREWINQIQDARGIPTNIYRPDGNAKAEQRRVALEVGAHQYHKQQIAQAQQAPKPEMTGYYRPEVT